MTPAGAAPDVTVAQVQRERFEQSLRGDVAATRMTSSSVDVIVDRIMGNPHLAGWIEAVRVATLRQAIADLKSWAREVDPILQTEGVVVPYVRQMAADLQWAAARLRDERLGR